MALPKVSISANPEELTIRINGYVHLYLRGRIEGFQAWVESFSEKEYCIIFYMDGNKYKTQYESKKLWLLVLKLLENKIVETHYKP